MFINVIYNTKALDTWEIATYRDLLQLIKELLRGKRILCDISKNNHCIISGDIHWCLLPLCTRIGETGNDCIFNSPKQAKLCSLDSGEICVARQTSFWALVLNSKFTGTIYRGKGEAVEEDRERGAKRGGRKVSRNCLLAHPVLFLPPPFPGHPIF